MFGARKLLLLVFTVSFLACAAFPLSYAQVAPKAVNTRIVETTRAGLDLTTRTSQTTDLATNVTTTAITGGTRPNGGTNLFHSFDFFTVGSKDIAHFQNDMMLPTTNIIARVIGDAAGLHEASTIDGILRTNNPLNMTDPLNFGAANLYLVNPQGVMLKENAQLNVGGSANFATADTLRFNGIATLFDAAATPASLGPLHIASVAAFGFTNPMPVAISIQGSTLQVASGQTLSMIGGDLTMTGGALRAPSGNIQIASLGSPGEVIPSTLGQPTDLGVSSFTAMAPITLTGGANLDANSSGSGTILIRGGSLSLQGASVVQAVTTGAVNGAPVAIDINVSGAFTANQGTIQAGTIGAGRGGDVRITSGSLTVENFSRFGQETIGSGNTGDFSVTTGDVTMRQGGQIVVATGSSGASGNLTVMADTIMLSSTDNATRPAGFIGGPAPGATGHGGDMRITTSGLIELRDGAAIDNSTFGIGNSGVLEINAGSVSLSGRNARGGFAAIFNRAVGGGGGDAGPVTITTDSLEVRSGAQVTTSSTGTGDGGDINITADRILLTPANAAGVNGSLATGLFARGNIGAGGDVQITAGSLEVMDGANLSVSSTRSGVGGTIDISADRVLVSGVSPAGGRAGITSQSDSPLATGAAGNVMLNADTVEIRDGGQISVAALGPGAGGNLTIEAEEVLLSGVKSGLSARINASTQTSGKSGNVTISTDGLEVRNGAQIQASTVTNTATKDGGFITVTADRVVVSGASSGQVASILAQTSQGSRGKGGDITITTDSLEVRDGGISVSTSTVGNAGNLTITANNVTLDQTQTSSGLLAATSSTGSGGNVLINTDSLVVQNGASVLSTTTGTGNGGSVEVNAGRVLVQGTGLISTTSDSIAANAGGAGNVTVTASESITVAQSGLIASSTGGGPGGQVSVTAPIVNLDAGGVSATTSGTGNAGAVSVNATDLALTNGAQITSSSIGSATGDAGIITIQGLASPADAVELTNSSILTRAENTGAGGSIGVSAGTIALNNATISASVKDVSAGSDSTQGVGNVLLTASQETTLSNGTLISADSAGTRNAGTVTIRAGQNFFVTNSRVTTEALSTSGGNINILADQMIRLTKSGVTTSVFGPEGTVGGDIFIDPQFVILQQSDILAQAFAGRGGNINIVAGTFLADPNSLVSASSQLGVSGSVSIQAPIQNLSGAMVPMRQEYMPARTLLSQRCAARMSEGKVSTFVVTLREGLPPEPGGPLPSPLEDLDRAVTQADAQPLLVAAARGPLSIGLIGHPGSALISNETCRC